MINNNVLCPTRNIRKPGDVGKLNFCTFTQNCNGLTSWSFEIPASAYCQPLAFIEKNNGTTLKIWVRKGNNELLDESGLPQNMPDRFITVPKLDHIDKYIPL